MAMLRPFCFICMPTILKINLNVGYIILLKVCHESWQNHPEPIAEVYVENIPTSGNTVRKNTVYSQRYRCLENGSMGAVLLREATLDTGYNYSGRKSPVTTSLRKSVFCICICFSEDLQYWHHIRISQEKRCALLSVGL